ncbi:hypothetical protein IWX90DRAFT_323744 [Phyllosticta citrichinensis]|uniref:Uncharacterized protein n=1 Tax=Phyllosticta citrichinensis TaxID=1130410 RepID=A0ABR1XJU6_9PEZI
MADGHSTSYLHPGPSSSEKNTSDSNVPDGEGEEQEAHFAAAAAAARACRRKTPCPPICPLDSTREGQAKTGLRRCRCVLRCVVWSDFYESDAFLPSRGKEGGHGGMRVCVYAGRAGEDHASYLVVRLLTNRSIRSSLATPRRVVLSYCLVSVLVDFPSVVSAFFCHFSFSIVRSPAALPAACSACSPSTQPPALDNLISSLCPHKAQPIHPSIHPSIQHGTYQPSALHTPTVETRRRHRHRHRHHHRKSIFGSRRRGIPSPTNRPLGGSGRRRRQGGGDTLVD